MKAQDSQRNFPVLGTNLVIPWEVAERAVRQYIKNHDVVVDEPTFQWCCQDACEGGGFEPWELDRLAPDWREHAREADN